MISRAGGWLLAAHASRRRRAIERSARRPEAVQEGTLLQLVRTARNTEFGLVHGFERIRSVADYQSRVPVRSYLDFLPAWTRVREGDSSVTWPGRPRYWAKTSGTTAGDKHIPVTREALAAHRRGGWDALLVAAERAGARHLLGGQLLFLGGSTALKPAGEGCVAGDLSGLVVQRLPPGLRRRYSPGPGLASIDDWERRIGLIAELVRKQDLRLLGGMPSGIVILFERVARACQAAGRPLRDLAECWPNLRVFVHGGVSFAPYQRVFDEWMGRALERVEVYPASEGFVAIQTEPSAGLTLMLDYGIFYEFIPVRELDRPNPRRLTVADVELGPAYAIVLTTRPACGPTSSATRCASWRAIPCVSRSRDGRDISSTASARTSSSRRSSGRWSRPAGGRRPRPSSSRWPRAIRRRATRVAGTTCSWSSASRLATRRASRRSWTRRSRS